MLIVASCNGLIRALDTKSGHVKWEYDIRKDGQQSQFHGDPLVTEDLIVVGTDGIIGHVYAFERKTGVVRWKYKVEKRGVASDIVHVKNDLYFVTLANELVSIDLQSGTKKWSFHGDPSAENSCVTCASPAATEERVYFGGTDGFAYALDSQSGKLLWKRDLGGSATTSAALKGQSMYIGTVKRHLIRLDAGSGAVLSDIATDSAPNRRLIVAEDSLLAFLGDEILASFDLDLKKLKWSAEATKEWTSARPYLRRGVVLAGNRRELVALRLADGTRAWSFQCPETIRGIGMAPDTLYVGTLKGPIFAYPRNP